MLLVEQQLHARRRQQQLHAAGGSSSSSAALSGTLNGSGSTLQLVYEQAAIAAFKSVQSGMTVNYGAGGSGKGRTDLASGVVNFAGSDSPIPAKETANFKGKTVLYYPILIAPITVSYNLSGLSKPLQLSAPVIANIFEGKITKWNDPAIAADNSGVTLPSTSITIAVRSDSSGTTQNFSQFLVEAAGSAWTLGSSSIINWPSIAHAGNGNSGVSQIIKSTPGAIGYVDYATAKASGLTFASIKNKDGSYVAPSVQSATTAAGNATVKPDLTFSAIWAPGASSYPITAQSWVLVYQTQPNANDEAMLKAYIGYLVGAGQQLLPQLGYAPLPASIDQRPRRSSARSACDGEFCDAGRSDRLDVVSTVAQADPAVPAGSASALSERRPLGDRGFQVLTLASGLLVLVILVLIAVSTTQQSSSWFSAEGLKIFTNNWNPAANQFGALAFIYGTIITAIIALVIAVPVSLGVALLLTEVVPYRWARPIVNVIDLLAVVPSVVWGLWGILVFAPWIQHIYASIGSGVNGIPVLGSLFGPPTSGASFFTAGIILAFMITPIVTSLSREVIATVPAIDKEGAYALGATRLEMIRGAVWPHSQGGVVGAVLLGLGRAMGETIAVALVIGSSATITSHLFAPGYNMPAVIANQFGEASGEFRAALMGIGVLLFVFTIIINVIARGIVERSARRKRGA